MFRWLLRHIRRIDVLGVGVEFRDPPSAVSRLPSTPVKPPLGLAQATISREPCPSVPITSESAQGADSDYAEAPQVIRMKCQRDWPDDFQMQHFSVDQQLQAVAALRAGRPDNVPDEVFQVIRRKAARDWPDDYCMRLFTEQQQVKAFHTLCHAHYPDVPQDILIRMQVQAELDWPDDYEMRAFTIEQQVKSYRKLHSTAG
jgi:hypothetical protein